MKKLNKILLVTLLLWTLVCGLWTVSFAAIPHLINYQGRLTDASGVPLDGSYSLTFRIYDAESAGNLLWQGTYNGVGIQKGIFGVLLGDVNDPGYNFSQLAFDKTYWLEIKVGDEVMNLRQKVTSAGYAIRTETAENALQAQNANTVANVGLSTVPVANKILPLDNNAKFPSSVLGLKVYDSGWFAVTTGTTYTKTHNLGTTKVLVILYSARDANGTDMMVEDDTGASYLGMWAYGITTTQITVRTAITCFHFVEAVGLITSGYARIIMLALE